MASYNPHHSVHAGDPYSKADGIPMQMSDSSQRQNENQPPAHKRVYQACIPCRRRKVRCDLGSVDNPHDPPCVRCRRESKHCFFSATRRKRKNEDGGDGLSDVEDDYIQRNGRKRHQPSESSSVDRNLFSDVPLTPGGSIGRSQPLRPPFENSRSAQGVLRRSAGDLDGGDDEPNTPMENTLAQTVMRREMYGPHDALDLLYKAATDHPHRTNGVDDVSRSQDSNRQPSLLSPRERGPNPLPQHANNGTSYGSMPPVDPQIEQSIDPELRSANPEPQPAREPGQTDEPGHAEALKVWARFRFVRAGWFTAQEAINYIDYYYTYLSPLTPVSPPTFKNPASHVTLLTEEPILTVTLLTIASRYCTLPPPGGHCRSYAIHEQLWTYLQGMIERVVWGQEAFGGGFCGSGADATESSSTAPWRGMRKGSLRTLGTIESLMILTEWHPRALHFPPSEAIDELLLPAHEVGGDIQDLAGANLPTANGGGKRIESWLEPAWRSDRMCWMLLSTAMGLAYELGVFDDIDELLAENKIFRPEYEDEAYRLRASRIKKLLLIYLTQLAGRLGWTSMVPESLRKSEALAFRKRNATGAEGTTPGTNPSSLSNGFNYVPDLELDDRIIYCWAGVSNAMHTGNQRLFRSRQHTTDIIQSGAYINLLKEFQPILSDWKREFDQLDLPEFIKHILMIEFEYVRIYVNSLSLQAVVERCTNNAGQSAANSSGATAQLSPQTQNYLGKLPLGHFGGFSPEDKEYVKEVVTASRSMLRTVVDGLLPNGYLKHCPVRTYFRIISGAMFLLKTFALGAPKTEIQESIVLVDSCVDALRDCVVDDVHLGTRFADLLSNLTGRLRNKFKHAPVATTQAQSLDGRSDAPNQAEPAAAVNGTHLAVESLQFGNQQERSSTPANVSATPFDVSAGTFPYPTGSASMFGPSTPANTSGMDGLMTDNFYDGGPEWNNSDMWYLPPGSAFFNLAGAGDTNVAMTAEGVNVGGTDMLDLMMIGDQNVGNGAFGPDGGFS